MAACLSAGGCATVTEGTTQPISVITTPEGGATCTLSNKVGQWSVVTPGAVVIDKSESVLAIHCSKPGYADASYYAASKLSSTAMVGAMIPYVGILDSAVNASSGAATRYEDTFVIDMKRAPAGAAPPMAAPAPSSKGSS